jgi:hypothetical protein
MIELRKSMPEGVVPTTAQIISYGPLVSEIREIEKVLKGLVLLRTPPPCRPLRVHGGAPPPLPPYCPHLHMRTTQRHGLGRRGTLEPSVHRASSPAIPCMRLPSFLLCRSAAAVLPEPGGTEAAVVKRNTGSHVGPCAGALPEKQAGARVRRALPGLYRFLLPAVNPGCWRAPSPCWAGPQGAGKGKDSTIQGVHSVAGLWSAGMERPGLERRPPPLSHTHTQHTHCETYCDTSTQSHRLGWRLVSNGRWPTSPPPPSHTAIPCHSCMPGRRGCCGRCVHGGI